MSHFGQRISLPIPTEKEVVKYTFSPIMFSKEAEIALQ